MPGVKLKHLKIHSYRNVRPGTELRFDDGINLVLGQNGSGKTTLLGLLSYVASNDLAPLERESFEIEYTIDAAPFLATFRVRNEASSDDSHEADSPFRYEVRLAHRDSPDICTIVGTSTETTVSDRGVVTQIPAHSPFRSNFLFPQFLDRASPFYSAPPRLHLPQSSRFDESLDAYLAMTGRSPVSQNAGSPPLARTLGALLTEQGLSLREHDFTPIALLALLFRAIDSPAREVRILADRDDHPPGLNFLSAFAKLLDLRDAAWKPQLEQIDAPSRAGSRKFDVRGSSFTFTRRDGTYILNPDLLSYGQKRLLAYLYYLETCRDVVIADELVNGLHHRWIAACMQAIGERQAFLTSQNPLLFEYVEFASIEQVETRFITCRSELVDGAEQLVWQNMPREDAERFYRGYQADIESIGDILINRGLW